MDCIEILPHLSSGLWVSGCQGNDDSVGKVADGRYDRQPEGVARPGQTLAAPLPLLPSDTKDVGHSWQSSSTV